MKQLSALDQQRKAYKPKLPQALAQGANHVTLVTGAATEPVKDKDAIKLAFPNTCGLSLIDFQAGGASTTSAPPMGVVPFSRVPVSSLSTRRP